MITQEVSYYPNTFQTKEYKEYKNGVLNVHTKYDENNNKVYMYLAYDNLEWERRFEDGSRNENGRIVYYKDNLGEYKLIQGGLIYDISKSMNTSLFDNFNIDVSKDDVFDDKKFITASSIIVNGVHYCNYYHEILPNGDVLKYNKNYFMELYYEYHNTGVYTGREMISFDELMEVTQFKDFLVEQRICPVNATYFRIYGEHSKNLSKNLFITD
jgi:hypothetical protein